MKLQNQEAQLSVRTIQLNDYQLESALLFELDDTELGLFMAFKILLIAFKAKEKEFER